jgi:hypothetical protein
MLHSDRFFEVLSDYKITYAFFSKTVQQLIWKTILRVVYRDFSVTK